MIYVVREGSSAQVIGIIWAFANLWAFAVLPIYRLIWL